MIGSRLGTISQPMIRPVLSPVIRADSTKSRLRSESVCARSTRAPQAQPVSAMIVPISRSSLEAGRKPKITISSGSAGMTRKMLASKDSRSSASPPR